MTLKKNNVECLFAEGGAYFGTSDKGQSLQAWLKGGRARRGRVVGIGHSFGLCRLLQQGTLWDGLVSVSGVLCLVKKNDNPHGVDAGALSAMTHALDSQPERMLRVFYARCGVPSYKPLWQQMNVTELKDDLVALGSVSVDARADWRACLDAQVPLLALGASDDAIVPVELLRENFDVRGVDFHLWQRGGHVLPLSNPQALTRTLLGFIGRVRDGVS